MTALAAGPAAFLRGVPATLLTAAGALAISAFALTVAPGPSALRVGALALIAVAAIEDLRTRRIRNALAAPAFVLALLGAPDVPAAALGALIAALPLLAIALAAPGAMGMGDVKLTSAAGALAGLAGVTSLWLTIGLAGGALGIVVIIRQGHSATVAYGPAIAAGALLVLI